MHWTGVKCCLGFGVPIRPSIADELCLDLPGGDISNRNRVWLWSCNGMGNQYWNWVDGAIHPDGDSRKCLDVPGSGFFNGNFIEIWDCNGSHGQNFGYDSEMQTIYLASSMSSDASMCVDVAGGEGYDGASVQIWSCNGLPNQQWLLGSGDDSRMALV